MGSVSTKQVVVARWLLRIGLAGVLLFAAVGATVAPANWVGFLPAVATHYVAADLLLKLFSVFQLALAVWLASGWSGRWAAGVMAVTMAGIIGANWQAIDIVFRDVAILCAALALAVLSPRLEV